MKSFHVADERGLSQFRHWIRAQPEFTAAERDVCCVDIWSGRDVVAIVTCDTERLAYGAECIATFVAIQREWGYASGWGLR